ncbi:MULTISPECIES: efflux RND transporter periplasmic adaptor subunit [Bacillus]|uniref:efflux RND transporter periplasmic adaptor subunit n=1 Tax=Bacillus TaxID=1386 RepID=UPI0002E078CC|nr:MULTISPECIES: efflux RND transporter periplasmic adaptor subunit [Bacillus]
MKKWIILIVVILLVGGGGATWYFLSNKEDTNTTELTTQTATVKKGNLEVAITGSGSITTGTDQDVTASNTVLVVESVSISSGDTVSKGDPLVTFENGDVVTAPYYGEIASVSVKSGSVASKGTVLLRMTNSDDITAPITRETSSSSDGEMNSTGGGSSLVVDTVKVTKGNVVKKGATIATFTDGSLLQAPVTGTITSLSISSGESIDSSTVVAHITDYTNLLTTISVDELDISKIKANQKVDITASAFEEEKFEGIVSSVATEGTASNGVSTFDVTVKITDPKNLKIGMSTEASILIESKDDALYVPVEAVYTKGNEKYVIVPSDDGNSTKQVTVETGITNDTYVEITKGLAEGDQVQIPKIQSSGSSSKGGGMMQGGDMPSGGGPSGGFTSGGGSGDRPSGNPPTGGGQGGK